MSVKQLIVAVLITLSVLVGGFILGSMYTEKVLTAPSTDYKDVGGNIDIEYYLEVSQDSIWVEGVDSKRVYSGKYKDLDSLITLDNM
jgi:hypothetical protein